MKKVAEFIKNLGMLCSVGCAHDLLDALFLAGEPNHALELMTVNTKRSWMKMLNVGSTMTTVAWDEDCKKNLICNHCRPAESGQLFGASWVRVR